MVPRLGSMSSNLWEPAVACNGNLWFPGWEPWLLTCGNRQFLAMVTCGSHIGTREFQPLGTGSSLPWTKRKHSGTGPLSKTKHSVPVHWANQKIVQKLFSYHFDMHLFRAKTFLCRPNSQTQTFRYRSIKQNKRFCYRLSKQNKTTLRTMSSNFLQSTDPSTGNVTFSGLEPWVSSFGNPQFLTMKAA